MRKSLYLIGLLSLFLTTSIVGLAYFYQTITGANHSATSTPTDNSIIEVDTFEEFYNAAYEYSDSIIGGTMDEFNPEDKTSDSNNRKTIRLTADILFTSDVLLNSDKHIDLGGFKIDLQGHDLNIKNHYDGTFAIYNGEIIDSGFKVTEGETENVYYGNIIIDCPNAVVSFPNTVIANNVNTTVINVSDDNVLTSAMEHILVNISNTGFNDFYNSKVDVIETSRTDICNLHTEANMNYCIYTYTDLDFIDNYYAYDVEISYSSNKEDILSNYGRVNVGSSAELVTLTITVKYNEVELQKVVNVHVVTPNEYAEAAVYVLLQHLEKYYDSEKSMYVFDKTFYLPIRNEYFDADYELTVQSEDASYSSNDTNDFFNEIDGEDILAVNLNSDIKNLIIGATTPNDEFESEPNNVSGQSSTLVDDDHTYALNIKNHLYGNQITINNLQPTDSGYTEKALLTDVTVNGYTRLSSISYDFDNNYENTYDFDDIENNTTHILLHVNKAEPPYVGQNVSLIMIFTFTSGKEIRLPIPIKYEPIIADNATGFEKFDPYYAYFNKEFIKTTNQYTYDSFDIPLSYNQMYPIYTFRIYEIQEDGSYVEMTTTAPGLFNVTISDDMTFDQFEANTKTQVEINPYYINEIDTKYAFVYIPLSKDLSGNIIYWGGTNSYSTNIDEIVTEAFVENLDSYKYKSVLTIPGIVRYQCNKTVAGTTERFADKELYEIAYELINGKGTYIDQKTFILTNTLTTTINKVDFSNDSPLLEEYGYTINLGATDNDNEINSLKGIDLLTGIKELDFNGTSLLTNETLNITEIEYISKITNLEKLDLSSTGIYDRQSGNVGFPTGDDNGLLDVLSNLNNLKELNLANNKIYDFSGLTNFTSLEKVDITNNSFVVDNIDLGIQVINNIINALFTTIVNALYGSSGATNTATIATLKMNGVEVVGGGQSGKLDPNLQDIIDALTSLEYQDKLAEGLDIALVYKKFEEDYDYNAYGLEDEFTITYNVDGQQQQIKYEVNGITFTDNGYDMFSIHISYKISYYRWPGFQPIDDPIVFTYDYKVSRY